MAKNKMFLNGATFVRADFHLHTKADTEFIYNDDPNFFAKNYIDQLEKEGIQVGIITNHNKFDEVEFKELSKNAIKRDIFLLAGVELSISNGKKGIHVLIVFEDSWFKNPENCNYIQQFINGAFGGIHNYDKPPYDTNSNYDFNTLCLTLDKVNRDYFIILAHVDDSSGIFGELEGRGLLDFVKSENFSKRVLGLQKARSRTNLGKINSILENRTPALVEGTDCAHKGIEGLGKGNECEGVTQKTFLKLGDYNFDAVKYALRDHTHRVFTEKQNHTSAYIKSIKYESKRLGEKTLHFSPSMNNLIGVRGSGKSSILESIRYLFDIELTKNSKDSDYKKNIVQELLGSGGKMIAEIVDDKNQTFIVEKIYNETTNIYFEGELQQNLKIDSIINNPLYFGQKDLSELGNEASTDELINRLVGNKLNEIQIKINQQSHTIEDLLREILKHNTLISREDELRAKKAELELQEKLYKTHSIDKVLSRQVEFEKDKIKIESLYNFSQKVIESLDQYWIENSFDSDDYTVYTSKENNTIFEDIFTTFKEFSEDFNTLEEILSKIKSKKDKIETLRNQFNATIDSLKDDFSTVKREINIPNINPDTYINITKELADINAKLIEIDTLVGVRNQLRKQLKTSLTDLKALWHDQYSTVKKEMDKINGYQNSVRIEIDFKGNKEKFRDFLKEALKGSGITDRNITSICSEYQDLIEVYNDLRIENSKIKKILSGGDLFQKLSDKFKGKLNEFLTFRVPDKYSIFYRDRPLKEHSLGQRASAIILFILSLKENDLILIDQPEDDLDNQTIYQDVIKELKKLKNNTQFIFATHNPNIPVLGDCEQIFACNFVKSEGKTEIRTSIGGIDDLFIQDRIVNIMEGGKDAFNQRKMIYDGWRQ